MSKGVDTAAMAISDERLAEMLAGLEGVTPGPWITQDVTLEGDDLGSSFIVGANRGGLVAGAHAWPEEIDDGDFERVEANAEHIARCDPDTIRYLVTREIERRRNTLPSSVTDEQVAKFCGDERNGGMIRDMAYTVWSMCHNPTHEDGNTDWFNDTLPMVNKAVEKLRAALSATSAPPSGEPS